MISAGDSSSPLIITYPEGCLGFVAKRIPYTFGSMALCATRGKVSSLRCIASRSSWIPVHLTRKVAARGDDAVHLRAENARMIGVGVGKRQNGAVRHPKRQHRKRRPVLEERE